MIADLGLTWKLTVSYQGPCLLRGIWPVLAGRSKATTSCQVQSFKGTGSTDHPGGEVSHVVWVRGRQACRAPGQLPSDV